MEEEAPLQSGLPRSDSEEEEEVENEATAKKHQQLVDALSALAGGKRRRVTERTEASRQVSEFDVCGGGADEKVLLSDLLQPISTSSALGSVRKQLKKAQEKKAVQLPLSKEENERVLREAAYAQTSRALAKWDPVVRQNRRAEQLVFPLQQERVAVTPVEEVMSSWKAWETLKRRLRGSLNPLEDSTQAEARTPLEEAIFNLLHKNQQPVMDPLLTPQEKASLQAMSLEEAQLRRAELQRARALQSYYEAKARREKKIKSKKYHKVLRKSKSRKVLQEFEALRKTNPQAALEQLEKIERARMEERMSLKHQNKGRWAKSTVIMAKYDLEARQAMQEQLARNKELTQKVCPVSDSEEDGNSSETERGLVPDVINEGHVGADPDNPWMLGKSQVNAKEDLPATEERAESEEEVEEEPPVSDEEALLQSFTERRQELQGLQGNAIPQDPGEEEIISEPLDVLPQAPPSPVSEEPFLSENLERIQNLEDIETLQAKEIPQGDVPCSKDAEPLQPADAEPSPQPQAGKPPVSKKSAKEKALIDLNAVMAEAPLTMQCPLVPTAVQDELEGAPDQRQVIEEAFAGDNVIADFLKEKRHKEQADKPKDVDLVLPGWGEWGGTGLKPSAKKRKRFIIKPAAGPPRKDRRLPHVIISEKRNILAAAHQVNQLPFPFDNCRQFECSIQAPTGSTWNTQRAFERLTAPRIITQPGHIIRPISAEDADLNGQEEAAKPKPDLKLTSPVLKRRHHRHGSKKKAR